MSASYARWGPTSRYGKFFRCYACKLGPGEPLEPAQAAQRLLDGVLEHDRQVALILGADQAWEHSVAVTRALVALTARKMVKTQSGTDWLGIVLEVDQVGKGTVEALAGELGEDAYRVAVALAPAAATRERMLTALRIARTNLQLIVNLYDDGDAVSLARFQRTVERAAPLKGRGILFLPPA